MRSLLMILMLMSVSACGSLPRAQEYEAQWDGYHATVWLESDEQTTRVGGNERLAEIQQATIDAWSDVMGQPTADCGRDVVWYVPATTGHFAQLCNPSAIGCSYSGDWPGFAPREGAALVILRRDVYENAHSYAGNEATYVHEMVHVVGACAGDSDGDHDHAGYWERTEHSVTTLAWEYAGIEW